MSRDEVTENHTIARSGTKQFFKNLEKEDQESSELIGQFDCWLLFSLYCC